MGVSSWPSFRGTSVPATVWKLRVQCATKADAANQISSCALTSHHDSGNSVGVRSYYARLGYYLEGPYMVKML